MRRYSSYRVLFLALAAAGLVRADERVAVGARMPDFTAVDLLSSRPISSKSLRGKIIVMDFWATWCGPCVREVGNIKRLHERFGRKVEFISVSLDSDAARCREFVREHGMTWAQVCDGQRWNGELAQRFDVHSIPAVYIIDGSGTIVAAGVRGEKLARELERVVSASEWR